MHEVLAHALQPQNPSGMSVAIGCRAIRNIAQGRAGASRLEDANVYQFYFVVS